MANVKFYRGLLKDLPTSFTATDEGSFYLTTDSQQLYNVIKDGSSYKLIPLGENITQFDTTATKGGAAQYKGQFAYIKQGNIFMISMPDDTGAYKWVQINSQSPSIKSNDLTAIADGSKVKIQSKIEDSGEGTFTDTVGVEGAGSAKVSVGTDSIIITVPKFTLTASSVSKGAKLAVGAEDYVGEVSILGDADTTEVAFNSTDKAITISANKIESLSGYHGNDTQSGTAVGKPDAANEGLAIKFSDNKDHTKTAYLNPILKTLDENDAGVKFVNGTATLNTYSKAQIDKLKIKADALHFRGTVGTGGKYNDLPTSQVQIGDLYKLTSHLVSVPDSKKGDLVIADGVEDDDTGYITGTITWELIPSGDDVDDYTLSFTSGSHKVQLLRASDGAGSLTLANDSKITLSDSGTAAAGTITIGHGAIGAIDGTVTDSKTSAIAAGTSSVGEDVDIFYTVGNDGTNKGIELDATGHVASIKTKKLTIKGNKLLQGADTLSVVNAGSAITVGGKATLKDTWQVEDVAGALITKTHDVSVSSNTLAVSASVDASTGEGTYSVDLVWKTFGSQA